MPLSSSQQRAINAEALEEAAARIQSPNDHIELGSRGNDWPRSIETDDVLDVLHQEVLEAHMKTLRFLRSDRTFRCPALQKKLSTFLPRSFFGGPSMRR